MRNVSVRLGVLVCAALACSCQKQIAKEQQFARVGGKILSQSDFETFQKMKRTYPTRMGERFPGNRSEATFLVETEALYAKAKGAVGGSVTSGADWQWKKRYYPAQMYLTEVLDKNLGFLDKELETYYKANRNRFADTLRVPVTVDSSAGEAAKDSLKDTVVYKPMVEVKASIAESLFLRKYPPDSAFWAGQASSGEDSAAIDTAAALREWVYSIRRELPNFFLKKVYEERFGKALPDSLDEWVGEGKVITPQDMEVILAWLPEGQRESYDNPGGKKFLAEWLLRWKLFTEKAEKNGFARQNEIRNILKWVEKYEVVAAYIDQKLAPAAKGKAGVDSAMVIYACWDNGAAPGMAPDSATMARTVAQFQDDEARIALEEAIYAIRAKAKVEFLQSDWKDSKGDDPKAMVAQADSLLGAGETDRALTIFRELTENFPFTEEGRRAYSDLAKVQTEKGSYREAIRNYRKYLVTAPTDAGTRCNTFFMIGFIYDEYLSKAELAEVQYRWILKNTPDCELCDDAEFMVLHLDEPMTTVEDLRTEARRQGRKIEDDEPLELEENADTAATAESTPEAGSAG